MTATERDDMNGDHVNGEGEGENSVGRPEGEPRPQRSARLIFTQAVLGLQGIAALFATLLTSGLARAGTVDLSQGLIWTGGLGLMVWFFYAAGAQRKPWGVWMGWLLQLPLLLAGIIDPAIAIIGAMFLALWITALRLGGRIDRERAERAQAAPSQEDA
jgi:hypothetical protein